MSKVAKKPRWTKVHRGRAREMFRDGIEIHRHSLGCADRSDLAAHRGWPDDVLRWYRRAVHERYCLDYSAGVVAEICQRCLGVVPGSPSGTGGRVCSCVDGEWVGMGELATRHGLGLVFPNDRVEGATGVVVGA